MTKDHITDGALVLLPTALQIARLKRHKAAQREKMQTTVGVSLPGNFGSAFKGPRVGEPESNFYK